MPFLLFMLGFLLIPVGFLAIVSLQDSTGRFTFENYAALLATERVLTSYRNSLEVSLYSAILGGIGGFLLAAAILVGGLPRAIRSAVLTFSGVASNFAGVPLALAFVFTLGNAGIVTALLRNLTGFDLRDTGFTLYGKLGLTLVYVYFQLPLMVLIISPTLEGLRRDWREASQNLGANSSQYWRWVALPIIAPSMLGAMILLFANAFGAQATAFQLTGGTIPLVTIDIGAQIRGDVLHNPGLGYAMAMGMVVVMAGSVSAYAWLRRRAERWQGP